MLCSDQVPPRDQLLLHVVDGPAHAETLLPLLGDVQEAEGSVEGVRLLIFPTSFVLLLYVNKCF